MAVKCPKCQFENPDDTIYCGKCAAPLNPSEEIEVSPTKTLETPKEEFTRGTTLANRYELIEEQVQASEWLERAYQEREGFIIWCIVFPYDPYRIPDEPKFREILKRVGLK